MNKTICARCGHPIESHHNGIALFQDGTRTHSIYDCFAYVKKELDALRKEKRNEKSHSV